MHGMARLMDTNQRPIKRPKLAINGWLNLYKPLEISSAGAVAKAKWLTQAAKMGHAGTLDPLADGVLPLALGEATKATSLLMNARKTYRFTIRWGQATETDDREGAIIETSDKRPTSQEIQSVLGRFVGSIQQQPPAYSALKIKGKRACDLAREGKEVVLASRVVHIHTLTCIASNTADEAIFQVECGKGTYVRSLARDIAQALGTVGHVTTLTREAVGPFTLQNAISLDFLEKSVHNASASSGVLAPMAWLLPIVSVLDDILALECDEADVKRLRHGQTVKTQQISAPMAQIAVLHNGEMVALCEAVETPSGFALKPSRIFNI